MLQPLEIIYYTKIQSVTDRKRNYLSAVFPLLMHEKSLSFKDFHPPGSDFHKI